MNYTSYADTELTAIEPSWLLDGFLEMGQVILLAGPGGTGKSMLTAWWAARVTRGELDGLTEPGNVGWVNLEDDPNTCTAWRLTAAGADLGRIIDLTESSEGEPLELPRDTGALRQAIDDNSLKLMIIDPLSAVSSRSLTTVLQARKIIMPLQRAARETGCVILVVHHERKDGQVAGSKGLVDSVRMALSLKPDPACPADKVLSVHKSNGTAEATPIRFNIEGDGRDAHVVWLDRATCVQRRTAWRTKPAERLRVVGREAEAKPPTKPPFFSAWMITGRGAVGCKEMLRSGSDLKTVLSACTGHPKYGKARAWSSHVRKDKSVNPNAVTSEVQDENGVSTVFMLCANVPINEGMLTATRAA